MYWAINHLIINPTQIDIIYYPEIKCNYTQNGKISRMIKSWDKTLPPKQTVKASQYKKKTKQQLGKTFMWDSSIEHYQSWILKWYKNTIKKLKKKHLYSK